MATNIEREFKIALSPDQVRDAMRDPALIEKSERSRDALEVEIRQGDKTDSSHKYEIDVVNYARSVKGIDKSKTEKSTTVVNWDLGLHVRRWTWSGAHAQVKLRGEDKITGSGDSATLRMTAEIKVGIPLVGKMVEKKIKEGFDENWPKYARMLEDHVKNG